MALGFTSDDLTALKAALVSGTLSVEIGDRKITYRSQKELIEVIKMVQAELAGVSTSETSPKLIQSTFTKGGS